VGRTFQIDHSIRGEEEEEKKKKSLDKHPLGWNSLVKKQLCEITSSYSVVLNVRFPMIFYKKNP